MKCLKVGLYKVLILLKILKGKFIIKIKLISDEGTEL